MQQKVTGPDRSVEADHVGAYRFLRPMRPGYSGMTAESAEVMSFHVIPIVLGSKIIKIQPILMETTECLKGQWVNRLQIGHVPSGLFSGG